MGENGTSVVEHCGLSAADSGGFVGSPTVINAKLDTGPNHPAEGSKVVVDDIIEHKSVVRLHGSILGQSREGRMLPEHMEHFFGVNGFL